MLRGLLVGMCLGAVACLELSPAQVAATVQTAQCEDFIRVMRAERDRGTSCAEARMAAEKAEPLCVLEFKCPGISDAGMSDVEASDVGGE